MKKNSIDRLREYQIKSGYTPFDLSQYEAVADLCIPADMPAEVRQALKNAALDKLRATMKQLPTEYQELGWFEVLQDLYERIQKAAVLMSEKNKFTFPDKLTYGTAAIDSFTAFVEDYNHDQDYLILVSDELFTFANLLSKSIGMLLIDPSEKTDADGRLQFNLDTSHIDHMLMTNHEAVIRFADLIFAYAITNHASNAKQYTPEFSLATISSMFRESFELFILGHEYSHLLRGHFSDWTTVAADTKHYVELSKEKIEIMVTNWLQETEADVLAAYLAITAMEDCDFASSYAGVDISSITLIILERMEIELKGKTLYPVTHPPAEVRREVVYRHLLDVNQDIKGIYEANTYVVDALWNRCMYLLTRLNELLQGAVNHSLINVPYFLTQRLLYRIGDKLLSDFEEAAK